MNKIEVGRFNPQNTKTERWFMAAENKLTVIKEVLNFETITEQ